MRRVRRGGTRVLIGALAVALAGIAAEVGAQVVPPPLSSIPVPRPSNLGEFVRDEEAAKILGKALFWDMQVGSDGVQACATCHFRAGADPRKKNQVSPGLLRVSFQGGSVIPLPDTDFKRETDQQSQGPNYTLRASDFPFRKLVDPTNRESPIGSTSNNVVSSQGGLPSPRDVSRSRSTGLARREVLILRASGPAVSDSRTGFQELRNTRARQGACPSLFR